MNADRVLQITRIENGYLIERRDFVGEEGGANGFRFGYAEDLDKAFAAVRRVFERTEAKVPAW